jgi:hypothetical protein
MITNSSPGIATALLILFHLMYFVTITLLSSLFIEKLWVGRSRWIIQPLAALSVTALAIYPGFILHIIKGLTASFSVSGILSITGFGILAGAVMSSL